MYFKLDWPHGFVALFRWEAGKSIDRQENITVKLILSPPVLCLHQTTCAAASTRGGCRLRLHVLLASYSSGGDDKAAPPSTAFLSDRHEQIRGRPVLAGRLEPHDVDTWTVT